MKNLNFYWSIVALQRCVSFCCTAKGSVFKCLYEMLSLTASALTWTDLILVYFFLKLIPKNVTLIPYEADTFQHELPTLLQPLLIFHRLDSCSLTGKACEDISSALGVNQTLTDLYLTNNALGNTGVRLLCERLSHPGCKLRVLW